MATKPGTVPSIWSPGAVYTSGPFVGQPTKVAPAGAVALDGHRPGAADPTPGEYVNYNDHWTTRWVVDWLSQGLATAAGNTHIVETDANGRTELVGIDLTDAVDRVLGNWTAGNTLVPAIILATAGGGGFQADVPSIGAAFIAGKVGAAGTGFLCIDNAASSTTAIAATLAGAGSTLGFLSAVGAATSGVTMETINSTSLSLRCIGNGATLNLLPKATPAAPVAGDMIVDSFANVLAFWNAVGQQQRVWSTQWGITRVVFSLPGQFNNLPATIVLINSAFNFIAGKRYTVDAKFSLGRPAGSTKFGLLNLLIGASASPDTGRILQLYQTGVGHLERDIKSMTWDFISPVTGVLAVVLSVGDGGGVGNLNAGVASVSILGHFD